MTYPELLAAARPRLGPHCKGCPVCDGRAWRKAPPRPGGQSAPIVGIFTPHTL